MASRWGGTLGTVVPAPGTARPTVIDWRIQVFYLAILGAPAPVLAGAPAQVLMSDPATALAPCTWLVLSRPPRPPWMAHFVWRATTRFAFTVAISVMSLASVDVSCMMAARSLVVAVTKFVMASTVSCWRYLLSGFTVALCVVL